MERELKTAVVVSDLHIGLPQFHGRAFQRFIESLPAETALILNGDTLDNPRRELSVENQRILDIIRDQSLLRTVIWLHGNHDRGYRMPDLGRVRYQSQVRIGHRLLIVHGDAFDEFKSRHPWLIRQFLRIHRLRVRLGAAPVHVAEFAKKRCTFLYRILRRHATQNFSGNKSGCLYDHVHTQFLTAQGKPNGQLEIVNTMRKPVNPNTVCRRPIDGRFVKIVTCRWRVRFYVAEATM